VETRLVTTNGASVSDPQVRLRPGIEPRKIAAVFASRSRVHIPGIFPADVAERIELALRSETPWKRVLNSGNRHVELDPVALQSIPEDKRRALEAAVVAEARRGFGYFYENFAIADLHAAGQHRDSYLMRVYEFLNSPECLEFARTVVGADDIALADAQGTCFRTGDFLTCHHDEVVGKERRAAYVLNFTREWQVDCGGLLQFIDADGHVAEAYVPTFNALNILRVPQPHSVSYVSPIATGARYSITGWFRAK
jgi:SM-20-related protein